MLQRPQDAALHNPPPAPARWRLAAPEFSFAFQPIVDAVQRRTVSFEALVRGPHGEPSAEIFASVPQSAMLGFDQALRLKAVRLAAQLNIPTCLNLNFLPNSAAGSRAYLFDTIEAARQVGIPAERLVFEVTDGEYLRHGDTVERVFGENASLGFRTAVDDFGAGLSSLRRLVDYQPHYIKLDRRLVANINTHPIRQLIVRAICSLCLQLSIEVVAEGVEQAGEYRWLRDAGITLFQGYYFGRPALEALPEVDAALF